MKIIYKLILWTLQPADRDGVLTRNMATSPLPAAGGFGAALTVWSLMLYCSVSPRRLERIEDLAQERNVVLH